MDDNRLAKIAKTSSSLLDDLQYVGTKVEHQHHERIGTLDKMQDMVL
jgi:hypothetical protein